MKAVLYGNYPACELPRLRRLVSSRWDLSAITDDVPLARKAAQLADADAIITVRYGSGDASAPRLRLIQSASSGVERLDTGRLPPGCVVCAAGGHEEAVAEYIIWAVLDWSLECRPPPAFFADGRWSVGEWTAVPNRREARGRTLGIVGFGHIGREAARRAKALGMKVAVLSTWRNGEPEPRLVDRAFSPSEKTAFLKECEFIAVCCPLNDATRGMIGWEWFVEMLRDAVIINVGRGPVIDEESFYRALRTRAIRGATIDVWYDYPNTGDERVAASRFSFHELPNAVVTPHIAARSEEAWDRRFRLIAKNLEALAEGRPLTNVIAASAQGIHA